MPRRRPTTRLADLAEAATGVFIARGFRRTQMSDVAEALGVAKGTVYLYVESKEALLDLALSWATGALDGDEPPLPIPAPKPGAMLRTVREGVEREARVPALTAALARKRPANVRAELEEILRELYDLLERHRVAIKLIDRCAADYPELARVWYRAGRQGQMAVFRTYLESPGRRRALRPTADVDVTARLLIETVTFWAIHRHWDPAPQRITDDEARETVIAFLVAATVKE